MLATRVVLYTTVGRCQRFLGMDEIKGQGSETTPPRFEISTVNELLARKTEPARPLFGDMWLTGELAVMFAEAGCGKSLLAVQIADSIARGAAFKPLDVKPRRQKVVYVDLESTHEQFCSRYRHENSRFKPYKFPDNFVHARLTDVEEPGISDIEAVIEATGAKVLVIDNLAHLMKGHSSNEAARLMRELRRLCRRDGISILLLVHSPPSTLRRGIEARDLPFSEVISALADNVFAVGRVGAAASERYLKHLRPGAAAHVFGAAHVPWFRIRKRANFTYFEFRGFAREGALRLSDGDRREWQMIDRIAELKRLKMPVRDIAKALDMSKTTVQRYAVMCPELLPVVTPYVKEAPPEPETDKFCDEPEDAEEGDHDSDTEEDAGEWDHDSDPEDEAGELDHDSDTEDDAEEAFNHETGWLEDEIEQSDPTEDITAREGPGYDPYPEAHDREAPAAEAAGAPLLERDFDNNDREIWVEKRDSHGRRLVWYLAQTYRHGPNGKYTRYEYRGLAGNIGETVDQLPTRESGRAPP